MVSIYERRRREPIYFQMRARNALQAASLLEKTHIVEAFWREASLALELIVKAVIAQRLEVGEDLGEVTKVPVSHNVPRLWTQAKLPKLVGEDLGRLIRARVNLMWAARYPAPNRDEDGDRDEAELWEHAYDQLSTSSLFRRPHSFSWENVDRIFWVANNCFLEIRITHGLSQRDGDIVTLLGASILPNMEKKPYCQELEYDAARSLDSRIHQDKSFQRGQYPDRRAVLG